MTFSITQQQLNSFNLETASSLNIEEASALVIKGVKRTVDMLLESGFDGYEIETEYYSNSSAFPIIDEAEFNKLVFAELAA